MHKGYVPGKAPEEYNFEEYCPHCESSIPIVIDNDEAVKYDIICPVCGRTLMLCTLCMWDQQGSENAPGDCDYHRGSCFRKSGRE